jgi:O-acetyl-ADP-ribose deacetylase (regulator of RNase III)
MLRYTNTTVFNVDAQTIVNTINCVGAMGAGLALEFKLRFPEMEKDYVNRCRAKQVSVGRPYLYRDYGYPWILNFPTKQHWKYPSKLEWIEQGLQYFSENYQKGGITSVAFPKLGCSNGGLNWQVISSLMEKYLHDLDIDVFICEDTEKEATGTEAAMVQMLNDMGQLSWPKQIGLRADIQSTIVAALPIHRFRELQTIKGVGKQTYKDIFSCLYAFATQDARRDCSQTKPEETKPEETLNLLTGSNCSLMNRSLVNGESPSPESAQVTEPQYEDLFYVILPSLEKALAIAQTPAQIAEGFHLPKNLVNDWLTRAEQMGKIQKLSKRPIHYIATCSSGEEKRVKEIKEKSDSQFDQQCLNLQL